MSQSKSRTAGRGRHSGRPASTLRPRLRLEALDDRIVPAGPSVGESTFSAGQFAQNIEQLVSGHVVGFGYAINQNGVLVEHDGDGFARTENDVPEDQLPVPFTASARMEIASVSKTITATATLKLLHDQNLDVHTTTIFNYLPPEWQAMDLGDGVASITFEQVLTHRSGFTTYVLTYGGLQDLLTQDVTTTNGSFQYETTNYSLLRVLIPYLWLGGEVENLADASPISKDGVIAGLYKEYVRDDILEPSGILNADTKTSDNPTLVYYFGDDDTPGYDTGDQTLNAGGRGWNLSADDLAAFLSHLCYDDAILAPETRQLMNDYFLGWMDPANDYTFPVGAFGTYFAHGGDNMNDRVNTAIMVFPNDVQASLVINSTLGSGMPYQGSVLKLAYDNAWPTVVYAGTPGNDTFTLRLSAEDPDSVELLLDGDVVYTRWIDTLQSLTINGLGGGDTFVIEDLPEHLDLVLDGGEGDDTFVIGTGAKAAFGHVHGNLTITGREGDDVVNVNDAGGIGEDYSIRGVHNGEIFADGTIWATNYTPEKLFVYDEVEHLLLQANTDPNQITLEGITSGMTVEVHAGGNDDTIFVSNLDPGVTVNLFGEGGGDSIDVWNTGLVSLVNVIGDPIGLPGSDDTLTLGNGDLGTVQGSVYFEGADGFDRLVLDDTAAPTGRYFEFTDGAVAASGGFGGVTYSENVESVLLEAGGSNDDVYVESLNFATELELYGHDGNDTFAVAGRSHNVDAVHGHVVVHGGSGYAPTHEPDPAATPEDSDWLHVLDDQNAAAGLFTIDQNGDYLHGRLNKFTGSPDIPALDVFYDQIEHTELRTGAGDDTIDVAAAPRFNQLTVYAGGGKDRIDVESTPLFAGPMIICGEAGDDAVRVSATAQNLGNLRSPLSIQGGVGHDTLAVYDTLSASVAPYGLDSMSLTRGGSAGIIYQAVEYLQVSLSDANNTMTIAGTAPGTTVTIFGNGGDDTLTAGGLASSVAFVGGAGDDHTVFTATNGDDVMTAMGETVTLGAGSLTSSAESRTVNGMGGNDRLVLNGTAGINDTFVLRPSSTPYAGKVSLDPFTPITYEQVEQFSVQGNPGEQDTLQINGQTEPNVIGGGVYTDWFTINLAAAGTSADPFLMLRNLLGQTMLTLTDYEGVAVPKVMGLLGADIFDVYAAATASRSRSVQLDGGSEGGSLKGDQLRVHYRANGATVKRVSSAPKDGKISIGYPGLGFGITYQDMEGVQFLPT